MMVPELTVSLSKYLFVRIVIVIILLVLRLIFMDSRGVNLSPAESVCFPL